MYIKQITKSCYSTVDCLELVHIAEVVGKAGLELVQPLQPPLPLLPTLLL